ncbi:PREDICTED: protein PLANT CADMIUM RESISTANCE 2-like [Branchiostoma belcheri]|uniref:Protein PLANT CADMIUM RESISTANCE 2-like n=1 Tax=Branchiostoma belcheri TaxID=7741 RepID=A0A6P4ZZX1_BRABE|nr:PREDICTED: protein PLANT CADMIUM RESISTANCE 2-like [Branchiostoma belcheri]XP_019635142.1 PREDICTED: protein PLANT CADMIUM RESISTANCE 2-like [Branchiostoma belcheri]KAI8489929.1 hypothetical protein Bbelb_322900 [Branchiostoma belcheri]
MGEWKNGLFGCFNNFGVCIITYFVPCVTAGQNAEKAGVGGCVPCAIVSMLGCIGIYFMAKTREKTRELKGIEGSFVMDCVMSWICPLCSLVQVAQELEDVPAGGSMVRE